MNGYMRIKEASVKWNLSERMINTLCLKGRIEGAINLVIPGQFQMMQLERKMNGLNPENI